MSEFQMFQNLRPKYNTINLSFQISCLFFLDPGTVNKSSVRTGLLNRYKCSFINRFHNFHYCFLVFSFSYYYKN